MTSKLQRGIYLGEVFVMSCRALKSAKEKKHAIECSVSRIPLVKMEFKQR